jgi:pimeloyl-ACP methyl ester carboxylesterase
LQDAALVVGREGAMKAVVGGVLGVLLAAGLVCAEVPTPGPEHEELGYWVGTWKVDVENKESALGPAGKELWTFTFEWFPGRFHVVFRSELSGSNGKTGDLALFGYDGEAGAYFSNEITSTAITLEATIADLEALRIEMGLRSAFYDGTRAAEYLAPFTPGKEHYNPEANELLSRADDQGAAARIEALRGMRLPTLVIHGRQDPMPESVAIENHALLNGSRLVWLDQCGHVPWMERPKALESALFEFLSQQRP